jgi:C-terminal processing protease CtpA/Prc
MWILAFMIAASLFGQSAETQPATPNARLQPAQVQQLVGQLAHPRYAVREQATEVLCRLDESYLPLLVEQYHAEKRFEPKRRIRYITEYIFHREQIVGRNGFMGVKVHRQVIPEMTDPTNGRPARGVLVQEVISGFPAERAGLENCDMIVALNGEALPEDPITDSFVRKVGSHRPNTLITLRVLRAGPPRQVRVKLGPEPSSLLVGTRMVPLTAPEPTPPQGVWILATEETSALAAAGLKSNELIRSIDGIPIGPSGVGQLEGILRTQPPGAEVVLSVAGTRVVDVRVKLGTRPPELINEAKDFAEARSRFMNWWEEQGGDLPGRPDGVRLASGMMPPPKLGPESTLVP